MIRRILLLFGLIFCAAQARAATCTTLSSGGNIGSAMASCGSGNTVQLNAGTYSVTTPITIPCGVSLSGPVVPYSQTPNQTATINGSTGSSWGFNTTAGCSVGQTIQYIAWNGGRPSLGGGFLQIIPGTQNVTIQNNWLHGVNSPQGAGQINGVLVQVTGGTTNTVSNITIQWNYFGSTSFGDCSTAMTPPFGTPESDEGAICGAVGIYGQVNGFNVLNNIMTYLEEPIKTEETSCNNGSGPCDSSHGWACQNVNINYNAISQYSRIAYETQCYWDGAAGHGVNSQNINYNWWGPRATNNVQGYAVSQANGCNDNVTGGDLSSTCWTHTDYNVFSETNTCCDTGIEIWGTSSTNPPSTYATSTTGNYNLLQGYMYIGFNWSTSGAFQFNNNTFNIVNNGNNTNCAATPGGGYFQSEWNGSSGNPVNYRPTCTGNTFSNAITGTYPSAAPTLSFSSPILTITNTGTNRDTNTTDWCTTDGSTPAPGSGTAIGYMNGGTITISGTQTVKCLGMWGALNQPYSYPSGYSYVPSSVVSGTYTSGPTLTSCSQTSSCSSSTITVGQFCQQTASCYYASVPATTNCSTTDAYGNAVTAWGTISGSAISIGAAGAGSLCSGSGQGAGCVEGVAAGSASATATVTGGHSCTSYPFTVTAVTPTLNGATMVVQSGGSTVYVAGQVTMCVDLGYITPTENTQQCGNGTDAYGTVVSGFASSVPADATIVGSTGVLTGVAAGSTTVSASVNSGAYTPSLVVTVATPPVTPAAAMQGNSGLQGNAGIQ